MAFVIVKTAFSSCCSVSAVVTCFVPFQSSFGVGIFTTMAFRSFTKTAFARYDPRFVARSNPSFDARFDACSDFDDLFDACFDASLVALFFRS